MEVIIESNPKFAVQTMEVVESSTFSSDFIEEFPSLVWSVEEYFEELPEAEALYEHLRRTNKYVRIVEL